MLKLDDFKMDDFFKIYDDARKVYDSASTAEKKEVEKALNSVLDDLGKRWCFTIAEMLVRMASAMRPHPCARRSRRRC